MKFRKFFNLFLFINTIQCLCVCTDYNLISLNKRKVLSKLLLNLLPWSPKPAMCLLFYLFHFGNKCMGSSSNLKTGA